MAPWSRGFLFVAVSGCLVPWGADARLLRNQGDRATYWFNMVAENKHCDHGIVTETEKPTPQSCFAKNWDYKYWAVVMASSDEEYKCYALPANMDIASCAEGNMAIYETRRGEQPVERNKTQSFHR